MRNVLLYFGLCAQQLFCNVGRREDGDDYDVVKSEVEDNEEEEKRTSPSRDARPVGWFSFSCFLLLF